MDEVVEEFLSESRESLEQVEAHLLALEDGARPPTPEEVDAIFRALHTIKGTCGFLGFAHLEAVTHAAEGLLGRVRGGELRLSGALVDLLLRTVDAVREMLDAVAETESDGDDPRAELVAALRRPSEAGEGDAGVGGADAAGRLEKGDDDAGSAGTSPPVPVTGEGSPGRGPGAALAVGEKTTSVRVDLELLDQLMNLAGELVLARNQLLQLTGDAEDPALLTAAQRVNLVTSELQEAVMRTRMQPIERLTATFPRMVREIARACGKRVRLRVEGADTELDRSVLETIRDPLTHLLRNAVDHGVETPEVRQSVGKAEAGQVLFRAAHESGKVVVQIRDDGRGIDPEALRRKAIERGLVSEERAAALTDREAVDLVFHPGLSTAEAVTSVSGRGVGMDVVRTNLERIGGGVDVQTVRGEGTSWTLRIPLTLAIVPAIVVRCRGERFAVPQVGVAELVKIEAAEVPRRIEHVHGAPVFRLRGSLLPLLFLSEELRLGAEMAEESQDLTIAVMTADAQPFGLVVDEVFDTEEIVVKALGPELSGLDAYAGATVMGDGRVVLILDVAGLARQAGLLADDRPQGLGDRAPVGGAEPGGRRDGPSGDQKEEEVSLLLVRGAEDRRYALPLTDVARLEEVPRSAVERAGGHAVVQYRGSILPLVDLDAALGARPAGSDPWSAAEGLTERAGPRSADADGPLRIVVHHHEGREVGFVTQGVVDIVRTHADLEPVSVRPGVRGCAVVDGRVVEVLDPAALLAARAPWGPMEAARAE
jgi:two-component system chemotaxis sensor kinase CheA